MDLNSLKLSDSTTIEILNPRTQVATGMTVTLRSSDSPEIQALLRANQNKRIQQAQVSGKLVMTAEQREEEGTALLVAAVVDWSGFELDGKPLECTASNVRMILADPAYAWIRRQVDAAFGDQTRFFE